MTSKILCSALVISASLLATPSFGQVPPPPADAPPPPGVAPPPPPGPKPPPPGRPPPPPPRGPAVILDRGVGGTVHVDVRCTDAETTRACVDTATQLFDKLNAVVQVK